MPRALLPVSAVIFAAALGDSACARRVVEISPGLSPRAQQELSQVEAEIDRIEAKTLASLGAPPDNVTQQVELLGKAMMYDKQLSVNRNEACSLCHMPEAGFTGPVSELNATTIAYPGSVRTRFSNRRPQSHAYATLSPVLHYNSARGDLVGGNFWDMRATGRRLANPAAEQAEGPPVNPVEMGLPDIACAVYRASQRPYRRLFEQVWGPQAFSVRWPGNVDQVCSQPGPPSSADPSPVHLSREDRGRVSASFDQMALSIAGYEASAEEVQFSSKFDASLADKAKLTTQEQAGYELFRGKGLCNNCHRDGGPGEDPLFTDFTAVNIGTPANPRLPFYREDRPDARGYVANPAGRAYVDYGVGAFLSNGAELSRPSAVDARWLGLAANNSARVQVPTLRNVDKRPYPGFVKTYGHNGYFTSLKMIVHFYNTRDTLRRCQPHDPGEGTTCWPAPESTRNLDTTELGKLGLTDAQEDDIVAFLKTLTDGYLPAKQP
ncbi:cytochrome c peroxidase [Phenylobacterium sp.]|uniref:cytochrome-c peroxidase n=1 Tax=Phenylobacterium sp. TaxID=1871053 RepID=UPI0025DCB532|nr:cytochrome c peroxidase [Phenylobacterium sp.]